MENTQPHTKSDISAIVLTFNSEDLIADCIDNLSFCKEIVVVDNGSADRTIDIAKRMEAKVVSSASESFAERRNLGHSKSKFPWVLHVDDDERVTASLRDDIRHQTSHPKDDRPLAEDIGNQNIGGFRLKRKNFYLGKHEWPYIETQARLFKKDKFRQWRGRLHETPVFDGSEAELSGYLLHYTHRDLASMLDKTIKWSQIEADLRLEAGHPKMSWWRFVRVMATAFFNSYLKQRGYKAGTAGFVESIYQAYSAFITYARLWEAQKKR